MCFDEFALLDFLCPRQARTNLPKQDRRRIMALPTVSIHKTWTRSFTSGNSRSLSHILGTISPSIMVSFQKGGSMLSSWVQLRKQQLADLNLTVAREISLSFGINRWWTALDPKYLKDFPDSDDDVFRRGINEALWLRVHLSEAIKLMREDLEQQGLGSKIILSSNVESGLKSELPHLEIVRESPDRIRFHTKTGKKGIMIMFPRKRQYNLVQLRFDEE